MEQETILHWALEREIGAGVDLALARMMPPGEQRQRVLRDWIAAEMPWTEVESRTSEEYLIERWNQRFGAKEDGQQPK